MIQVLLFSGMNVTLLHDDASTLSLPSHETDWLF